MDSSRARESRCHSKARTCATGLRLRSLSNYVHLVDTKFTKWSNFVREAWLIKEKWNKRSCLKPPMNADARRCSAPLIGVDRRASAVPYPRRYEVCSLCVGSLGGHKVHKMVEFKFVSSRRRFGVQPSG